MSEVQYVSVSYDFIDNGEGELMMVMDKPEGEADDENTMFVYDGAAQAMLVRNNEQIVRLPLLTTEIRSMLSDGREKILVTEMEGEEIGDVYEAKLEVLNAPLPIPAEYNKPVSFTIDGGHTFEGDFDSEFTGKGKFTFEDGDVYEGDFVKGKLHGRGKVTATNGDVLECDFVDGVMNGKGIIHFANGDVYEGDFAEDDITGKGKYTYANGDVYEGDFEDLEKHGKGKMAYADGRVEDGIWVEDEFVGSFLGSDTVTVTGT
jgi:hypothetical protein